MKLIIGTILLAVCGIAALCLYIRDRVRSQPLTDAIHFKVSSTYAGRADALVINSDKTKEVLRITAAGKIVLAPDATPDEAKKAFVEYVTKECLNPVAPCGEKK